MNVQLDNITVNEMRPPIPIGRPDKVSKCYFSPIRVSENPLNLITIWLYNTTEHVLIKPTRVVFPTGRLVVIMRKR